jgi:hypothetical protein
VRRLKPCPSPEQQFGYDTWPEDAWKYIGGTNDWGGMTMDEKRGIAYFPLGSPTYDFYGADRTLLHRRHLLRRHSLPMMLIPISAIRRSALPEPAHK